MTKYKLLEFKDGTFGVAKVEFFGLIPLGYFVDLDHPEYKWKRDSPFFSSCKGSLSKAKAAMEDRQSKYDFKFLKGDG